MKKFIKNLIRLFWYIPYRILKYLRFGKVLYVPIGWDTLFPLAPYSEGGLLRKDFLELCKRYKISTAEYHEKKFGKLNRETNTYEFWTRVSLNQEYLQTWWV